MSDIELLQRFDLNKALEERRFSDVVAMLDTRVAHEYYGEALVAGAKHGHLGIVEAVIEKAPRYDLVDPQGGWHSPSDEAVTHATLNGHGQILSVLLDYEPDQSRLAANFKDAVEGGHSHIVAKYIQAHPEHLQNFPLDVAAENNHWHIINEFGPRAAPNNKFGEAISHALENGQTETVDVMLTMLDNPKSDEVANYLALIEGARYNNEKVVDKVLQIGDKEKLTDPAGGYYSAVDSAVRSAIENKNTQMLDKLIEYQPEQASWDGNKELAFESGDRSVLERFISAEDQFKARFEQAKATPFRDLLEAQRSKQSAPTAHIEEADEYSQDDGDYPPEVDDPELDYRQARDAAYIDMAVSYYPEDRSSISDGFYFSEYQSKKPSDFCDKLTSASSLGSRDYKDFKEDALHYSKHGRMLEDDQLGFAVVLSTVLGDADNAEAWLTSDQWANSTVKEESLASAYRSVGNDMRDEIKAKVEEIASKAQAKDLDVNTAPALAKKPKLGMRL